MAQGWSHGPVGRWSRPGRRSAWWARTNFWSGSSAPAVRRHPGPRQNTSAMVRPAVPRRVLSRSQPLTASAPHGASAARQARRGGPRVRPPGTHPSPPADSVTMRRLRPALAMTRRWPRTGSACRPATRSRNAGSLRCSGAHPAAGREPESPMHGKHRRSQTRRAPRSRLEALGLAELRGRRVSASYRPALPGRQPVPVRAESAASDLADFRFTRHLWRVCWSRGGR
jgi:hypothetical protein